MKPGGRIMFWASGRVVRFIAHTHSSSQNADASNKNPRARNTSPARIARAISAETTRSTRELPMRKDTAANQARAFWATSSRETTGGSYAGPDESKGRSEWFWRRFGRLGHSTRASAACYGKRALG